MGATNCCSGSAQGLGPGVCQRDGMPPRLSPGWASPTCEEQEEGLSLSSHSLPAVAGIDSRYGKRLSLKPGAVCGAEGAGMLTSFQSFDDFDVDTPSGKPMYYPGSLILPLTLEDDVPDECALYVSPALVCAPKLSPAAKVHHAALVTAAKTDDAAGILQHIGAGASSFEIGEALCNAARYGCADAVRELVGLGIDVNYIGIQRGLEPGFTPLQLAAAGGHHMVCEQLLDALADVEKRGRGTPSTLEICRQHGHHEVESALRQHLQTNLKDMPEKPNVLRMDEKVWEKVREFRPQPGPPVQRARRFRGDGDHDSAP